MTRRIALTLLLSSALAAKADLDIVLDEKIMSLSLNSAKLSKLAYLANDSPDGSEFDFNIVLEDAHYYVSPSSPDMAIVAKVDGYCYASFRGTEPTSPSDWLQNFDPGTDTICNEQGECCDAREGFVDAYNAPYKQQLENDVKSCVETCDDMDECLVLTGHSQGGAIANVAAVVFAEYKPYVYTFGQPGSVHEPCPYINSNKYIRYVNAIMDGEAMEHDLVPFVPMVGSRFQGCMIVISHQTYAVASFGLLPDPLTKDFSLNIEPFLAHTMSSPESDHGYTQRIMAIMAHNKYPVPMDGWKSGDACGNNSGECASGRCDDYLCMEKEENGASCNEDSDCLSGNCAWYFKCKASGSDEESTM